MNEIKMQKQVNELRDLLEHEKRANKILNDLVGELQFELEQVKLQRDAAIADVQKDCRLCAKSLINNGTGEACNTPCRFGSGFVYRGLIVKGRKS